MYLFECAYLDANEMWYFDPRYNSLNCFDFNKKLCIKKKSVPWEKSEQYRLFNAMYKVESKLILIPYNASSITVYDIIEDVFVKCDMEIHVSTSCMVDENIYMTAYEGKDSMSLVSYSIKHNVVEKLSELSQELKFLDGENWSSYIALVNDELIFAPGNGKGYICYNLDEKKTYVKQIKEFEYRYYAVVACQEGIVALAIDDAVAVCEFVDGTMRKYEWDYEIRSLMEKWNNVHYVNGRLYVNYINSDPVFEIDLHKQDTNIISKMNGIQGSGWSFLDENGIVILPTEERLELIFESGKKVKLKPRLAKEIMDEIWAGKCVHETTRVSLEELLERINGIEE